MPSQSALHPASGQFENGEHRFPVRVYFEDTDLSGVVYHANYLRYMERARSDMLRQLGIDQRAAQESGEGVYAVTDVALRYRAPARLDDDLTVRSQLTQLGAARCVIAQSVWREDTELTRGSVTVAFLDSTGRPRRQPADWIDRFSRLAPLPS
ncbi:MULTISPECIES: tol-pal system-associated acyl-CoA thioesterase [Sphingobium]|uniref:tol-pal system-associated acyl-CoA thioesterase n=1 Tax=Sphingobium TaxID=165695 RepID=UPI0015EC27D3|nr:MULTISPECIES: tol-pal system-associated acyl-CoA thioesterase [Sphingobium]MCW2362899.1 acyl-CoA thioester hydrolase [Sphingobium sp. B10D3B]MCW2400421.1 acyl-CoA thioester hydrolase [Sphingobium sp. B10D7B]MCW2407400.1 acyl-CoA thioester hydrolase [Sphingobium xanthum]